MVFGYGFIDIIIKKSALTKAQIDEIIKNNKVEEGHFDNNLIVIRAGMSEDDAQLTAQELIVRYKILHIKDFVFIKQFYIVDKCDWLNRENLKENLKIANEKYEKGFPYFELVAN